jgi:tetratricopeptide (TPR) repeat protein
MEPAMAVLSGRLNEALGHKEDALANYRVAADSRDRQAAAIGRLREIVLRVGTGDMPRKDAINALELLTTVWRGDETEAEGLALLAHLYTLDNRFRDALHTMRVALTVHPNSDYTRKIQDEAAVTFDALFLGGKADALPPVEALGMFYDFRDLTPIGRRGDEMIRRLTDRLVSVDLLDQAAELLQHQVDHRLQGAARAQVATRLAVIYLMNRKPDRALSTLQTTRTADLSNELRDQCLLLEARALSDIGRYDLALELIVNINSHEAIRLRSDILWAARRWRLAAEQIEILYGDRWREFPPLSETERFDILRAAIGYSLGDEPIGLGRVRERYAAKMADTPDRRAFDVVSAPVGTASADFQEIAKKIAGVDSLDTFLRDMRTRYPDSGAISPDATNKTAPPAAPAKPTEPAAQAATPDKSAVNAPVKPDAAAPPPPKAPVKPDQSPTGSISRMPRAR